MILDLLECGAVTLTAIRLLAPHLTEANHRELLERARHKTKRDVELLVATINPRSDVPTVVRKLPSQAPQATRAIAAQETFRCDVPAATKVSSSVASASRPAEVKPLAPERYKI